MPWWAWMLGVLGAILALLFALLYRPRIEWRATYDGHAVRARMTLRVFFTLIPIGLNATACRKAAGLYEARITLPTGKERIFNIDQLLLAFKKPRTPNPNTKPLLRALLKGIHVHELRVRARVGTGDAAGTALLCGAVRIALQAAVMRFVPARKHHKCALELAPDFSNAIFRLELAGIAVLHCAQIIFDAVKQIHHSRIKHGKDGKKIVTPH